MRACLFAMIATVAVGLGGCVEEEPELGTVESELTFCSITCDTTPNPCPNCSPVYARAVMETSCSVDCAWKDVAMCECREGEAVCGCAW